MLHKNLRIPCYSRLSYKSDKKIGHTVGVCEKLQLFSYLS